MKYILAIAAALLVCAPAQAERFNRSKTGLSIRGTKLTCTSTTDVRPLKNVLYKNENKHGGRGRTFLDQDHQLKGVSRLKVAGLNGTIFACFGLYRCDQPYGCRYYQAMCKDTLSNAAFIAAAKANGGNYVLVGTGGGKCFKVKADAERYGDVRG